MRIRDYRVIPRQWGITWRQAGSLPLLAALRSVFQGRALSHQWPAGTVELEGIVVGRWIKGQSVESWGTEHTK